MNSGIVVALLACVVEASAQQVESMPDFVDSLLDTLENRFAKLFFIQNPIKRLPLAPEGIFLFGHKFLFGLENKSRGSICVAVCWAKIWPKSAPPCAGRNFRQRQS